MVVIKNHFLLLIFLIGIIDYHVSLVEDYLRFKIVIKRIFVEIVRRLLNQFNIPSYIINVSLHHRFYLKFIQKHWTNNHTLRYMIFSLTHQIVSYLLILIQINFCLKWWNFFWIFSFQSHKKYFIVDVVINYHIDELIFVSSKRIEFFNVKIVHQKHLLIQYEMNVRFFTIKIYQFVNQFILLLIHHH